MPEILHFVVTGDWVTTMSRDMFWLEKRTYKEVEHFLLNCMHGTELPKSTLQNYAKDVLLGKRKFIGNTGDDSYTLVDDNTNIAALYKSGPRLLDLPLVEEVFNSVIRQEAQLESLNAAESAFQIDYGWLAPSGQFIPVEWADHSRWALEYVENNMLEAFIEYRTKTPRDLRIQMAGDFLVYEKGWILLHSPMQGPAFETRDLSRRRTKAQIEFLFDYYMLRKRTQEANNLYKESDSI